MNIKYKKNTLKIIPASRLKIGLNIWNLAVIDNIDIKDHTFSYGNIFNVVRNTSHATLKMVFQFELSETATNLTFEPVLKESIFSKNQFINEWINKFNFIINNLYQKNNRDFGTENINILIQEHIE